MTDAQFSELWTLVSFWLEAAIIIYAVATFARICIIADDIPGLFRRLLERKQSLAIGMVAVIVGLRVMRVLP